MVALLTLGYPREKSSISQRIISLASKTKKVEEIASMEEYCIAYIDPQLPNQSSFLYLSIPPDQEVSHNA